MTMSDAICHCYYVVAAARVVVVDDDDNDDDEAGDEADVGWIVGRWLADSYMTGARRRHE